MKRKKRNKKRLSFGRRVRYFVSCHKAPAIVLGAVIFTGIILFSSDSHDRSHSPANLQSSSGLGGLNIKELSPQKHSLKTLDSGAIDPEQEGFRFRDDNGSESGATWLANQDADISRNKNLNTRLRVLINATGDPPSTQYQLEYKKSTDSTYAKVCDNSGSVAYAARGAVATGSTSLSIPYPSGIAAGDLLVVFIANKRAAYPTLPSGWTLPANGQATNTGTGDGTADQGYGRTTVYVKEAVGTESGNLSVTITSGNSAVGRMFRYTKGAGYSWSYAAANGADNTQGTAWSITANSDPNITAGDMVVVGSGINTDAYTFSSEAISATGVTFGAMNERQDSGTTTGQDCALVVADFSVSSGTSSASPVYTMTASGSWTNRPCGSSVILRIRQVAHPIQLSLSNYIAASGENTTAQLTPPSGKSASADFVPGRIQDDENPADAVDIKADGYTELEWCLIATETAALGDVYQFRVTAAGTPLDAYTVTPQWTIDAEGIFEYRRSITIDHTKVGSGCASDLSNFPVVISLSGNWLKTTANGGNIYDPSGYDIIFKASDGVAQLDHEIERYDGSTGELVAWVKVPTLYYNQDTLIYMYYGNSGITSSTENPAGVWDGYVGVWHLKESGSGTAGEFKDSTTYVNHGQGGGGTANQVPARANGKIGYGQQFDGSNDWISIPGASSLDITGDITISMWLVCNNPGTTPDIITKGAYTESYSVWSRSDGYRFALNNNYLSYAGGAPSAGTWYHFVATRTGSDRRIYLDGNSVANDTYGTAIGVVTGVLALSTTSWPYNGILDEVRASNTGRDACWIQTEFNNQRDPSAFYSVGEEEGSPATAVDLLSFTARGQGSTVLVEWETAQEIQNLGFNLYRMAGADSSFTKLNRNLIPGLISSVKGRRYSYTDTGMAKGALCYYLLEDVDLSGKKTMHGPVCVDWDDDSIPDDQERPDEYEEQAIDDKEDKDESGSESGQSPAAWTPSPWGESASWVKVSTFRACQEDDGVSLEWVTSFEADNLGFHLYRERDGRYYQVTADLVPGSVFNAGAGREHPGQRYVCFDAMSERTGRESYWLDCVGLYGARASFGPINPEMGGKPVPERLKARFQSIARRQVSREVKLERIVELRKELKTKEREMQASRAVISSQTILTQAVPGFTEPRLPPNEAQWALAANPAVKISVKEEGWFRVGQPELVAAGLSPWVDPRYLQLYVDGEEQSMMVTGSNDGRFDPEDAVEFYGRGLDTAFTDTRVYWLVVGTRPGRRLDTPLKDIRMALDLKLLLSRGLRGRGETLSFPYSVELKERTFYFAALNNGEDESFFGSLIYTEPVNELINAPHPDSSAPTDAKLEVVLQGATDSSHRVKILFNNQEAGLFAFSGQHRAAVEIKIPHRLILDGENILTLEAQGGAMDASLVDYIRLTYWRTYTADEDSLKLTTMGTEWLSIAGFSSSDIRVVDITDPARMFNVSGSVRLGESDYAITFKVPGHGQRALLAFTGEKIKGPAGVAANIVSSWHARTQGADVVVISSRDFLESLTPLRQLREQQGFSVALVDVEDIYDEFNFGSKSPWQLREFLSRASSRWVPAPRFLMLVGDASYDPRDYMGFGDFDLVPAKYVNSESIKTASDDWFVDFDDDSLPNMAVGRLPVVSAAEAEAVVSKIIRYESAAGFMNEALLVADANDSHYDFESASAQVAALLPQDMTVRQILRGQNPAARNELLSILNQGQLLVNYVGHGSTEVWKGNLLISSDARDLTNSPYLPFLVSMTCLNGFFQDPSSESMAETFLKAQRGGAVAVWASSSLTFPPEQILINRRLIELLFSGQGLTLGEAVALSKQASTDMDVRRTWILFGDPATRFR